MRATAATRALPAALALSLYAAGPAPAQDALSLELNSLQPTERGCRLTFVVMNGLAGTIDRAAFETALFNVRAVVERLTILDFRELPPGKTKVRQFDLNWTKCPEIGRVLINDATECSGPGIEAKACIRQLSTGSKAGVEFGS